MKNHYTKNLHEKTIIQTIRVKDHHSKNFMIFFVVINEINKHKAKIYHQCMYTHNYYKRNLPFFFTEYKNEWK